MSGSEFFIYIQCGALLWKQNHYCRGGNTFELNCKPQIDEICINEHKINEILVVFYQVRKTQI